MSKCISGFGEFSAHTMSRDGTFFCMYCGVFDGDEALSQLRDERARAEAAGRKVARVQAALRDDFDALHTTAPFVRLRVVETRGIRAALRGDDDA